MRLLLVEDDAMIGEAVLDLLRAEHYAVDWLRDGALADAALETQAYDLVVLDLGLPGKDGLDVLRSLRARKQRLPVLITTARDAVRQRIDGLDAGADDYLLKPYDPDELLARIRALLRRAAGRAEPVYDYQGLQIQPATREVTLNGQPVALSAREWAVVARAARRPPVQLEGRDQQQRGRGLHPRAAQEAGQRAHPQRAWRRLHDAQGLRP